MKLSSSCTAALIALLIFAPGLAPRANAQTGTISSVQADTMARGNVLASLTKTINSKKVKPGDNIKLKTMGSVTLSNGTSLPRGTSLTAAPSRALKGLKATTKLRKSASPLIPLRCMEVPYRFTC